jgi:Protein kinase domain
MSSSSSSAPSSSAEEQDISSLHLGNGEIDDVSLKLLSASLCSVLEPAFENQIRARTTTPAADDKDKPKLDVISCAVHMWRICASLGDSRCPPFPTVATALLLMWRALHSDRVAKTSRQEELEAIKCERKDEKSSSSLDDTLRYFAELGSTRDQLIYVFAALLLACKVEETLLALRTSRLWRRLGTVFREQLVDDAERDRFFDAIRVREAEMLIGLGFDVAVALPHLAVLRLGDAAQVADDVKVRALSLCTASLLSPLCLYNAEHVAAGALYGAGAPLLGDDAPLNVDRQAALAAEFVPLLEWLGLRDAFWTPPAAAADASPANGRGALPPLGDIRRCRSVEDAFDLRRRVSSGTFGTVWEAVDRAHPERGSLAVKLIHSEFVVHRTDGIVYRALREMLYLLRIRHPNIVAGFEVACEYGGDALQPQDAAGGSRVIYPELYIVMEFVHFDLLRVLLHESHERRRFNIGQVKNLMRQLLTGVRFIHTASLVHRDLKLESMSICRSRVRTPRY